MAATVSGKIQVNFSALLQNTVGLGAAQSSIAESYIKNFASGIGADQADRIYSERDKSISGATDIDLRGSLVDALGAAMVMVRVKALLVIAADANTAAIQVGGDAAAALIGIADVSDIVAVRPGGILLLYAPDA